MSGSRGERSGTVQAGVEPNCLLLDGNLLVGGPRDVLDKTSNQQTQQPTTTKSGEPPQANERRAVRLGPLTASSDLPTVKPGGKVKVTVINRPPNPGRRSTD